MYSKVLSASIKGVTIDIIGVECDISNGLPVFDMVGLLGSDIKEAKERIRAALKNSDIYLPPKRITINLSPSNIRKQGNIFDLPIAVGLLTCMSIVKDVDDVMIIGELGLDGRVHGVNGVLPVVYESKKKGIKKFIIPKDNLKEGNIVNDISIAGVSSIKEVIEVLNNHNFLQSNCKNEWVEESSWEYGCDYAEVKGQESVKRAAMIAAAGMHNLLLVGPPGTGKTMIAERFPTILPPLSKEEAMEFTKILSITENYIVEELATERPFRMPHHSITPKALVGGGTIPRAGEITKAHMGVLFLDELAEFKRDTLDMLRQPMEKQKIIICRNNGNYEFPANFMLIGATNPCKCGYYPDRNKCNCTPAEVKKYINRISGPFLDRMDIVVYTPLVKTEELGSKNNMTSEDMRKKVIIAREIQRERYKEYDETCLNGRVESGQIEKFMKLNKYENEFLMEVFEKMGVSARGFHKIVKVARTIADLDEQENIMVRHLAEAIEYRDDLR